MDQDIARRFDFARALGREAGQLALRYFADRGSLAIDRKGAQDWVSDADRNVETFVREKIGAAFPDDGIVGEEQAAKPGSTAFDWVIDPIDGTTNFVNGIPSWTVVLAGVKGARTEFGVIHDPNVNETFAAMRGHGAHVNDLAMHVATGVPLSSGTVGVGYSNRVESRNVLGVISDLIDEGAMYHRNASGALSLAYVASGRLMGYVEEHMNAWDCLAGQLMIAEAGGRVEDQDASVMIRDGGRVIASAPEVFGRLVEICEAAWPKEA